jgi:hypothetical protein
MATHLLKDGRRISLKRLSVQGTYSGALEGTVETISAMILKGLADRVARILAPGRPLQLIQPEQMPLPSWMLIAELESNKGVRIDDPDYKSTLYVCWFAETTDLPIDLMIENLLSRIDWEQFAEDFDSTYI